MKDALPLSALLSHALVAFTIECDNEVERHKFHTTTRQGVAGRVRGPWLVSMAMWSNCLRFLDSDGVTVQELERRARTKTNLAGMLRWGYITIESSSARGRAVKPRPSDIVRPTAAGARSREIWRPVPGIIEERWRERFGAKQIEALRQALQAIVDPIADNLPDGMPILRYALVNPPLQNKNRGQSTGNGESVIELPTLLSKVLLAFALEFERASELSLAICADLLRVLNEEGVRLRDLPKLTGVSKEAIRMAMGILRKRHLGMLGTEAGSKNKLVRLTAKGADAQKEYRRLLHLLEDRWEARYRKAAIDALRNALREIVGDGSHESSRLWEGLEPPPEGWRASLPQPETLPHFPMVLHRGGYPDGS